MHDSVRTLSLHSRQRLGYSTSTSLLQAAYLVLGQDWAHRVSQTMLHLVKYY